MLEFHLTDAELGERMDQIAAQMEDTEPLMGGIALELLAQTEANFEAEGRPKWAGLKVPRPGGKILQVSGQLAGSVTPFHSTDEAGVGSNKAYAAIQQLGGVINMPARSQKVYFHQGKDGEVGRRFVKKSKSNFTQWGTMGAHQIGIPSRPYLPFRADGSLQPEAEEGVMDVVNVFLRRIVSE